jgi:hypothetical protein
LTFSNTRPPPIMIVIKSALRRESVLYTPLCDAAVAHPANLQCGCIQNPQIYIWPSMLFASSFDHTSSTVKHTLKNARATCNHTVAKMTACWKHIFIETNIIFFSFLDFWLLRPSKIVATHKCLIDSADFKWHDLLTHCDCIKLLGTVSMQIFSFVLYHFIYLGLCPLRIFYILLSVYGTWNQNFEMNKILYREMNL